MALRFEVLRKNKTMTDADFERKFVNAHNDYRQKHGAPPLALSRDLCDSAQKWADHLLSISCMQHSSTDNGENIYYASSSVPKNVDGKDAVDNWYSEIKDYHFSKPGFTSGTGKDAVDNWYSEIKDYHFSKPGFTSGTGHFTQVVWKDTREVGVGLATDGRTTFVVGQYHPAGNISNAGYFEKNVLPPGSSTSARHSTPIKKPDPIQKDKTRPDPVHIHKTRPQGKSTDFEKKFVNAHNDYRQKHGAPPLALSRDLCDSAQKWADHLLSISCMKHSSTDNGENIYYASSSVPKNVDGKDAVDSWYSEIKDYHFSKPGFTSGTGHFTQVVWKDTREVGVGLATDGRTTIVVGQYHPAGNISNAGYFEKNVLPPGSSTSARHSTPTNQPDPIQKDKTHPHGKSGDLGHFQRDFLQACNNRRAIHGSPALRLDTGLSSGAQTWAESLLKERVLKNSSSPHGENIWAKTGSAGITATGQEVVESWYEQAGSYDFSKPGPQDKTGQFSQLVWRSSTKVGVGMATSGTGMVIVVAHFEPAGNITNPGYYAQNVLPKGSTVTDGPVKNVTLGMQALKVNPVSANELDQFVRELLKSVNAYRSQHGAGPLQLSPALTKEAQEWAAHLISTNTLKNSNRGHGETIFCYSSSSKAPPAGSYVTDSWYKNIEKYDFSSPGFKNGAGNFTQMVWRSSKQLGVGLATDGQGKFIAVAFYDPAGNITNPGYFKDNVKPKGSRC
ncbi:hypothetical protein UPYG_G00277080 [Umbra pygmaea]|uniref:SCP domain-containing protein n=1 Tax=Umbra pygmaea TaxID=75934 RepID=A0ABD0WKA0_UMBPY